MARGHKTGGRGPGTKNKATLEREAIARDIAARTIVGAHASGRELAKEKLDKFLIVCEGAAKIFQPASDGTTTGIQDWKVFAEWMDRAIWCAAQLAKYQSPTFRAEHVIIDQAPASRPTGQVIDLATDVVALQARYQRMIKVIG